MRCIGQVIIYGLIWFGNNSLAYYDIIDITPGTNSDFIKRRSKDEFEEMMKYGSPIPDIDNSDIKELTVKMVKVFHVWEIIIEWTSEMSYCHVFITGTWFSKGGRK